MERRAPRGAAPRGHHQCHHRRRPAPARAVSEVTAAVRSPRARLGREHAASMFGEPHAAHGNHQLRSPIGIGRPTSGNSSDRQTSRRKDEPTDDDMIMKIG